jgi:general secretion pathway protein G
MKTRKSKGFTMIELLVSVTIIAVLTVIGAVSYSSVNKRSRDVKRKSDLEQIRSALEMYRSDQAEYPNAGLTVGSFTNTTALASFTVPSYMPSVPSDPNADKSYYYQPIATTGVYNSYCICAKLETIPDSPGDSTCTVSLPADCNYGLKNP